MKNTHFSPSSFIGTKNPRQLRAIQALLRGPCSRVKIDQATGASNGPQVIAQLRGLGLSIPCERILAIDRDGAAVWPGVYRLTNEDQKKLLDWQHALRHSNGEHVDED